MTSSVAALALTLATLVVCMACTTCAVQPPPPLPKLTLSTTLNILLLSTPHDLSARATAPWLSHITHAFDVPDTPLSHETTWRILDVSPPVAAFFHALAVSLARPALPSSYAPTDAPTTLVDAITYQAILNDFIAAVGLDNDAYTFVIDGHADALASSSSSSSSGSSAKGGGSYAYLRGLTQAEIDAVVADKERVERTLAPVTPFSSRSRRSGSGSASMGQVTRSAAGIPLVAGTRASDELIYARSQQYPTRHGALMFETLGARAEAWIHAYMADHGWRYATDPGSNDVTRIVCIDPADDKVCVPLFPASPAQAADPVSLLVRYLAMGTVEDTAYVETLVFPPLGFEMTPECPVDLWVSSFRFAIIDVQAAALEWGPRLGGHGLKTKASIPVLTRELTAELASWAATQIDAQDGVSGSRYASRIAELRTEPSAVAPSHISRPEQFLLSLARVLDDGLKHVVAPPLDPEFLAGAGAFVKAHVVNINVYFVLTHDAYDPVGPAAFDFNSLKAQIRKLALPHQSVRFTLTKRYLDVDAELATAFAVAQHAAKVPHLGSSGRILSTSRRVLDSEVLARLLDAHGLTRGTASAAASASTNGRSASSEVSLTVPIVVFSVDSSLPVFLDTDAQVATAGGMILAVQSPHPEWDSYMECGSVTKVVNLRAPTKQVAAALLRVLGGVLPVATPHGRHAVDSWLFATGNSPLAATDSGFIVSDALATRVKVNNVLASLIDARRRVNEALAELADVAVTFDNARVFESPAAVLVHESYKDLVGLWSIVEAESGQRSMPHVDDELVTLVATVLSAKVNAFVKAVKELTYTGLHAQCITIKERTDADAGQGVKLTVLVVLLLNAGLLAGWWVYLGRRGELGPNPLGPAVASGGGSSHKIKVN